MLHMKSCPHCGAKTSCISSYGTRFPCGTRYNPVTGITQGKQCASQVEYMKTKGTTSK